MYDLQIGIVQEKQRAPPVRHLGGRLDRPALSIREDCIEAGATDKAATLLQALLDLDLRGLRPACST